MLPKNYSPKECPAITPGKIHCCYPANYTPKNVDVLVRKKNGKWQVKVNGKGKWIDTDYDPITETMSFTY